jgi:hypothetical protein
MQYLPWLCHRRGAGFNVLTDSESKLLFVHGMINTTRHCLFSLIFLQGRGRHEKHEAYWIRGGEDTRNMRLIGSLPTEKMVNTVRRPCTGAQRCSCGVCGIPPDSALHGSELPGGATKHEFEARWRRQEPI